MHDREYNKLPGIDQIEHPVGELAQHRSPGTRLSIHLDLRGRLCLDAGKRDPHSEQEMLSRSIAS